MHAVGFHMPSCLYFSISWRRCKRSTFSARIDKLSIVLGKNQACETHATVVADCCLLSAKVIQRRHSSVHHLIHTIEQVSPRVFFQTFEKSLHPSFLVIPRSLFSLSMERRGTGLPNPPRETKFSGANGDRETISAAHEQDALPV